MLSGEIREFRHEDIKTLLEIVNKGYIIKEDYFTKEIESADKRVLVYDDNGIKGLIYLETLDREKLEFMINVYVEPKERGKGIGTALYNEIYKLLKEIKPKLLITEFRVDKNDSTSFYKKLGFQKWYGYYEMHYRGVTQPYMDVEFRPYEDKDYEQFAKARQEGFYQLRKENDIKPYIAFELSEEDRKKALKIKECIYLAFDNDKLVAISQVEGGSIERIVVTPEYRGKGYGRKATQYAINKAINNGEKLITLEVVESNTRAINLYKSLGFEVAQNNHLYKINNKK